MPTYVFRCPDCKAEEDVTAPSALRDTIKVECPECGQKMRRKFVMPMAQTWAGKFHDRWDKVSTGEW